MAAEAPTVDDVRRIAAIATPILRNLEITHCYSLLAAAVAARRGEGANWCTYATWASRQAGRSIRGEDLLDAARARARASGAGLLHPFATLWRRLLRRGLFRPDTRLGRLTAALHTPFDAFERASDAVARGNLKVFEEIGLEFARYLDECPPDDARPRSQRFLDGLRPGDPPDGQRYLRQAFAHYERRARSSPTRRRARSSPCSRTSRSASTSRRACSRRSARRSTRRSRRRRSSGCARSRRCSRRRRARGRSSGVRPRPSSASSRRACSARRAAVAREVITDSFMVLSLPGRVLALGTHLADEYPEALREPGRRGAGRAARAVRAGPARARRLRRPRLVGARPADALHRPPVLRVPPARPSSSRAAVHRRAGREPPSRRRARRRALTAALGSRGAPRRRRARLVLRLARRALRDLRRRGAVPSTGSRAGFAFRGAARPVPFAAEGHLPRRRPARAGGALDQHLDELALRRRARRERVSLRLPRRLGRPAGQPGAASCARSSRCRSCTSWPLGLVDTDRAIPASSSRTTRSDETSSCRRVA